MRTLTRIACILLPVLLAHGALAQNAPVDVRRVDFNRNEGPLRWNNVVVEVQALENPNPEAPNSRYVDNIKIIVTLGYEGPGDGFTFYRAEATLVTLQVRSSKKVGFWMPAEVVQRDNLPQEPRFWLVEIEVDGQPVDLIGNRRTFSSNFQNRQSIESFKSMASGQVGKTEGIFVPTYLSPNPYVESGRDIPAFIRKEPK